MFLDYFNVLILKINFNIYIYIIILNKKYFKKYFLRDLKKKNTKSKENQAPQDVHLSNGLC
jgi:hypothetical protein